MAVNMHDSKALYKKALKFYQDKNIAESEKALREIISVDPHHADSLHMMAVIGHDVKRYDLAEELARMAIIEDDKNAGFYFTLGNIQVKLGKLEDAIQTYKKTTELNVNHLGALLSIATICRDQGAHFRNANMFEAALHHYNRALEIRPNEDAYSNVGYIYYQLGRYQDAINVAKKFAKHFPRSAKAHDNIAVCYDHLGEFEEAYHHNKKAAALDPNDPIIYANMASTLKNLGRLDESIPIIKKAIALAPDKAFIFSNLILTMLYADSVTAEDLAEKSREFGKTIADPLLRKRAFTNDRNPDRKLRIGYVSPDFRHHAVNYFLAPIYKANHKKFELYAYSKVDIEDKVTAKLKTHFDHWRDIKRMSDDEAADIIERDKIDILIDLAGHTANNGLMVFARKPAPIQVTWLGYTATTGMKAMDYRITDSYAEPPGMTEHLNTEELWRLPDIFCVYTTPENDPSVIDHPPFEDNGYVTFGCFNNFTKVTNPVLETWAQIMAQVPDSRLLLEITGIQSDTIRTEVEERLAKHGLPMERVILEPRKPENQYVLYNKIDIALDPFPAVGGTTSIDTLWMGVPLVSLAGKHFGSRMGVSILSSVGLPELIAQSTDEYVSIAVNLAKDQNRLRDIRHNLRDKTVASPLMDEEKFVHNMENSYQEMWKKWVSENEDTGNGVVSFIIS